jgi:NAD(P)-dependent dehydrogenase (short-subunit alcohol dehydrogenase family)
MMNDFEGRRLLVVGASVSIGSTIALEAAAKGVKVVAAARRKEKLDEVVAAGAGNITAVTCDCSVDEECSRVVDEAVSVLGGLDWLVYTPALFLLRDIQDMSPQDWRSVFQLNVTGAALVTQAAAPHLAKSRGRVVWFSSVSTSVDPHWPGLASYAVSKAALMKLAQCWRYELPDVGFTIVQVGETEGSDGPNQAGWTEEQVMKFLPQWTARGQMSPQLQDRTTVAAAVLQSLSAPSYIEHITVVPPRK